MLQNRGNKLEHFTRYQLLLIAFIIVNCVYNCIYVFSTIKDNLFKDKRENIIIYKYAVHFRTNIEP